MVDHHENFFFYCLEIYLIHIMDYLNTQQMIFILFKLAQFQNLLIIICNGNYYILNKN